MWRADVEADHALAHRHARQNNKHDQARACYESEQCSCDNAQPVGEFLAAGGVALVYVKLVEGVVIRVVTGLTALHPAVGEGVVNHVVVDQVVLHRVAVTEVLFGHTHLSIPASFPQLQPLLKLQPFPKLHPVRYCSVRNTNLSIRMMAAAQLLRPSRVITGSCGVTE